GLQRPYHVPELPFLYSSDDLHDKHHRAHHEGVQETSENDEQPSLRRSRGEGDLYGFR
ncbi:hypothetical protein SAMN05216362_15918, partial [Piscibacillus halophilus]